MAVRKHALLVGVSEYAHVRDLKGPAADLEAMTVVLEQYGFTKPLRRILKDHQATKKEILRALDDLQAEAGPDDTVVFYYTGHGSRHALRMGRTPYCDCRGGRHSGTDLGVEPKTNDRRRVRILDAIVPHDSGGRTDDPTPGKDVGEFRDIFDVEFDGVIRRFNTRNFTLIFDTCFAGTITRGAPDEFLVPKAEQGLRLVSNVTITEIDRQRIDDDAQELELQDRWQLPRASRAVVLAACKEDEFAGERDFSDRAEWKRLGLRPNQRHMGAFTFHLQAALYDAAMSKATPDITWDEIRRVVERQLRAENKFPVQTPILFEGNGATRLFQPDARRPSPYLRLHWNPTDAKTDGGFWIAGGAAHGITRNEQLKIRNKWSHASEDDSATVDARVVEVKSVASRVVVVENENRTAEEETIVGRAILAGDRGFEVIADGPEPDVKQLIRVVGTPPEKHLEQRLLIEAINSSPYLKATDAPNDAAITVHCLAPRLQEDTVGQHEMLCPGLGALGEWTWAAERDGALVARTRSAELVRGGAPSWLDRNLLQFLRLLPWQGKPALDHDLKPIDSADQADQPNDDQRYQWVNKTRVALTDYAAARARELVADLERYVRFQRLLRIGVEDSSKRHGWDRELAAGITLRLERRSTGGNWLPVPGENELKIDDGDDLELVLSNESSNKVRVSLVEFNPDYSIRLLLPSPVIERSTRSSSDVSRLLVGKRLRPGDQLRISEDYWGQPRYRVSLPQANAWWVGRPDDRPSKEQIRLKLLVSTCDADFELYEQDGSLDNSESRTPPVGRGMYGLSKPAWEHPLCTEGISLWGVVQLTLNVHRVTAST